MNPESMMLSPSCWWCMTAAFGIYKLYTPEAMHADAFKRLHDPCMQLRRMTALLVATSVLHGR